MKTQWEGGWRDVKCKDQKHSKQIKMIKIATLNVCLGKVNKKEMIEEAMIRNKIDNC